MIPVVSHHHASEAVPTASIAQKKAKKATLAQTSFVRVITQKQIKASGVQTVTQVLASQASIQLQDMFGDGTKVTVSMLGFGANAGSNTLILINGVPQNNPDLSTSLLNQIPLNNVQRIIIMPGSQSVLYGDQAVAGVINIITKDIKYAHANVSLGYGSYNHQVYSANISNAYRNGFSYYLGATENKTDNYRDHNKNNDQNLHLNLGYQYDTGRVGIFYNFYHQNLQYPGALTGPQESRNRRQKEPNSPDNNVDESHHNLSINWKQLLSNTWFAKSTFDIKNYSATGQLYGAMTQFRRIFFIDNKFIRNLKHSKLTVGASATHDAYQFNSSSVNEDEQQYDLGLYSLWNKSLSQMFSIDLGARAENFENTSQNRTKVPNFGDSAFVTNQAFLWHLNKNSNIYIRRSGNFRFPKTEENAFIPAGVTHLKTQTGSSYDLGYHYVTQRLWSDIALYYLRLNNEIIFDPTKTATQKYGVNRNLAKSSHAGLNASMRYHINPHVSFNAQYSYTNAVFRAGINKGKRIPMVAENTADISTTFRFLTYYTLFLQSQYISHRYASGNDANTAQKGIPGYVLLNSSMQYDYKHIDLVFRINNITNKYYNSYASLISGTEYYYPAPGRNYMLTLNLTLW